MSDLLRILDWDPARHEPETLVHHEWLVTNGLGGYASGTVAGVATRRYHGLLIAAMPAPLGRMMMLNHLTEKVRLANGKIVLLGGEERTPQLRIHAANSLQQFRLQQGLPVWTYRIDDAVIEKRVWMPREQNTVFVAYRQLDGDGIVRLKVLPSVHFRSHDAPVSDPLPQSFTIRNADDHLELTAGDGLPTLRLTTYGCRTAFTIERQRLPEILYRIEESRGYESVGDLWSPGYFRFDLSVGHDATIVASTEPWDQMVMMRPADSLAAEQMRRDRLIVSAPPEARQGVGAELVLAADQLLIRPVGRAEDLAFSRATGDDARTLIAGYHWFTDWGRDTMISLDGLTLCTGRHTEAGDILRLFAHYVKDGLIPNLFPEGEREGLYHTADATLWFFHAVDRYLAATGDETTLRLLLPTFEEIIRRHEQGTRFHIGVDPADELVRQGQEGYALTWMDAKLGDWIVTPRRGKAVEINALWYNALRLMERWTGAGDSGSAASAAHYAERAQQVKTAFNRRFWNPRTRHLFDLVDGESGDDPACRPNQLLAISLPHPVLNERHWPAVLDAAREQLLTPRGLRSLSPRDPEYKRNYHGDLRTRDAAYHQGTVWGWLIGPYVDAFLRVHPDRRDEARELLQSMAPHLDEACVGSVSEVFDAESPFTARGCCAQAWSVAELLRCWVHTAPEQEP
jgi:predicted glycogen debranching enzyme